MARTNKYTSVNFNEIYEKKFSNNPLAKPNNPNNPSSLPNNGKTKTIISNSRIQGNMLVLSRPSPKPISTLDLKEKEKQERAKLSSQNPKEEDKISLRPQGRTGTGPAFAAPAAPVAPLVSPSGSGLKSNKFVPPHLRPGFVGREERPGVNREGICGPSPPGRPKSGGGYERMMGQGVEINNYRAGVDPGYSVNRYASRGTRPNSSG